MNAPQGTVILVQSDHYQDMLLRSALLSMNLAVRTVRKDLPALHEIKAIRASTRGTVLVCADLQRIASERMLWSHFSASVNALIGDVELLANNTKLMRAPYPARRWAMQHGAHDLIPRLSHIRLASSLQPLIDVVQTVFGIEPDRSRISDYISAMHGTLDDASDGFGRQQRTWHRLEASGRPPKSIGDAMMDSDAVPCSNRCHRLTHYPNCFLGNEATSWLSAHLACSREQAVDVGSLLLSLGHIYHATKDQMFHDGPFFYRHALESEAVSATDLDMVIDESQRLRGFDIQDRTWRGLNFKRCFVGSEAAHWMSSFYGLSPEDAIALGQTLHDLCCFRHVSEGHDFVDQHYFYRLTVDH